MSEERVKIDFDLAEIRDGEWPPTDFEGIWAQPLDDGNFEIDNVPFYVIGLADKDVVSAHADGNGTLLFDRVVRRGGHSTFWIFLTDLAHSDGALFVQWWSTLETLGCGYESVNDRYYAIDVPSGSDAAAARRLLQDGEDAGVWHFADGYQATM